LGIGYSGGHDRSPHAQHACLWWHDEAALRGV